MTDWNQLFSEVSDLSTPPRLRERVLSGTSSKTGNRSARRRFGMAGKWGLAAAATVVVLIGLALAAHTRDSGTKPSPAHGTNDYQIVPGVRIGAAAIGDTRKNIESAIGKADAHSASGDSITATYRGAGVIVTYGHVVRFRGQPVQTRLAVLIRTTSPAYSTTEGIHVGSTLGGLKRAYSVSCAAANRGGENECAAGNTTFSVYEGLTATRPFTVDAITVTAQIGSDGTLLTPIPASLDLPPATFPQRDGWQTGSSNDPPDPADETFTWASTTHFRDAPFSAPPGQTLRAMAPDDILIEIILWRPAAKDAGNAIKTPAFPLRLDGTAPSQGYPDSDETHWFQRLGGAVSEGRQIDVWVFTGRRNPTPQQIGAAQSMLDDMKLPDWPPQ